MPFGRDLISSCCRIILSRCYNCGSFVHIDLLILLGTRRILMPSYYCRSFFRVSFVRLRRCGMRRGRSTVCALCFFDDSSRDDWVFCFWILWKRSLGNRVNVVIIWSATITNSVRLSVGWIFCFGERRHQMLTLLYSHSWCHVILRGQNFDPYFGKLQEDYEVAFVLLDITRVLWLG